MDTNQRGFGLIELMISILVASIIVTGLYSLLTSSVVSFGFSSASTKASQSSRQVNNLFETLIMQAGFINYKRAYSYQGFQSRNPRLTNENAWKEGQFIYAVYNESTGSDELFIRYFGASESDDLSKSNAEDSIADGYIFDCLGRPTSNKKEMYLRFYVNKVKPVNSGDPVVGLWCEQYYYDASGNSVEDGNVLIEPSITDLRVLASSNTTSVNSNGFFSTTAMNSWTKDVPEWKDVSMIKYGIVTSQPTGQKVKKISNGNLTLTIFEKDQYDMASTGDAISYKVQDSDKSNMHRVITGNIPLVNKICLGGTGC